MDINQLLLLYYYYTCIYNACKFSNNTKSKGLAVTRWAAFVSVDCLLEMSFQTALKVGESLMLRDSVFQTVAAK